MKIRNKLILDFCMFIAIWIVMKYKLTGNLLHEVLGLVLLAGFLAHVLINRRYYIAQTKALLGEKKTPGKAKAAFALNVIMPVAALGMLISSVAISKDLFSLINGFFGNYILWRTLHVICAIVILICMFLHVLLHGPLFASLLKRSAASAQVQKGAKIGSRILAVILAVAVLKLSFDNVSSIVRSFGGKSNTPGSAYEENSDSFPTPSDGEIKQKPGKGHRGEEFAEKSSEPETSAEPSEALEESGNGESTISLNDYLSSLNCTGCGRHCSLIAPQCGRGVRQAEEAETEYYSTYSSDI